MGQFLPLSYRFVGLDSAGQGKGDRSNALRSQD